MTILLDSPRNQRLDANVRQSPIFHLDEGHVHSLLINDYQSLSLSYTGFLHQIYFSKCHHMSPCGFLFPSYHPSRYQGLCQHRMGPQRPAPSRRFRGCYSKSHAWRGRWRRRCSWQWRLVRSRRSLRTSRRQGQRSVLLRVDDLLVSLFLFLRSQIVLLHSVHYGSYLSISFQLCTPILPSPIYIKL